MTVKELKDELEKMPEDAVVKRQITADYGTIDIENIRLDANGNVIVD